MLSTWFLSFFEQQLRYNYFNFWLPSFLGTLDRYVRTRTVGPTTSHGGKLFASFPLRQSTGLQRWIHEGKNGEVSRMADCQAVCDNIELLIKQHLICLFVCTYAQIWREYDSDGSGFIEADELKVGHAVTIAPSPQMNRFSLMPSIFAAPNYWVPF